MKRIIVIGGGFAGFWSAVSASRQLNSMGSEDQVEIMLINKDEYLGIRPRFYEKNPKDTRVPLKPLLDLAGVNLVKGEVTSIDINSRNVIIQQQGKVTSYDCDRLVLATGSQVILPDIKGLREFGFSTDTYSEAMKLENHLNSLVDIQEYEGKYTAVVIGGGFTGLEVATEMTKRMQGVASKESEVRVILVERSGSIGEGFNEEAKAIIEKALRDMKIEVVTNQSIVELDNSGIILESGERIPTRTAVWTGGVTANPLAETLPVLKDKLGRLPVDSFLQVRNLRGIYAAGDIAVAKTDEEHVTMMSCQHAIPMGKVAGHNAVCNLLGIPGIPYRQEEYVTCLDLGTWGGLYTNGWERNPVFQGEVAKQVKQGIMEKITPINYMDRESLYAASAPMEL
jgi:NADH:ubiquinone reductase (H+-translocating)